MQHPFVFRANTLDEAIFREVLRHNEYRLPRTLSRRDIIIDIGAHIGSFCYAALIRGAGLVLGYEAERANYRCAVDNLKSFGPRVRLFNQAVWRSDRRGDRLFHGGYGDQVGAINTGGGNVFWPQEGCEVEAVALDDVLTQVTDHGQRRVRLIKLDCEAAEFPILLTATRLGWVDEIVGEFHEVQGLHDDSVISDLAAVPGHSSFTMEGLQAALADNGFRVTWFRRPNSNLGMFWASRRPIPLWSRLWQRLQSRPHPVH